MALRTAPKPIFIDFEGVIGEWVSDTVPPTSYSDFLELESLEIAVPEQQTVKLIGRRTSTLGLAIDSQNRATDSVANVTIKANTFHPALLALAMGASVSEETQSAALVSEVVTTVLDVWVPLGSVGLAADGTGTEIALGTGAYANIGVVGDNNGITITALEPGTAGNSITVTVVDPVGNNVALSVAVAGTDITVTCATDGTSAITSTAAQVIAAILAKAEAAALVTASSTGASTGAGVMIAVAQTSLANGAAVDSSKWEIDTELGMVRAIHADAVGTKRVSAHTAARTWEQYQAGAASSQYVHIMGKATNQISKQVGLLDIWRANLSPDGPFIVPSGEKHFQGGFKGDLITPTVAIRGAVPTRPWRFRDRTA